MDKQRDFYKVSVKSGLSTLLLFFLCITLHAQNNMTIDVNQLSEEGKKHYQLIESLKLGSALAFGGEEGLAEDVFETGGRRTAEKIVSELEEIAKTDPNYAPVFYELGARCALLGKEFGEPFFKKAEEAFRKYGVLTGVSVEDHYSVINTLRSEYGNNALCGDWVGVYEGTILGDDKIEHPDYKLYIRIQKSGNNYIVREKSRIADESEPFSYIQSAENIVVTNNSISWKHDYGDDYDWSGNARENGVRIGHSRAIEYCSAVLSGNVLNYCNYYIVTYFDRNGRTITSKQLPERRISLYRNNENW